jgi:DNA helicase-2/ATP-dependent DNA helicase PcrA
VINTPARGIGKTTVEKIDEYYATESAVDPKFNYWNALQTVASNPPLTSAGTAKKLAGFVNLLKRLLEEQPKLMVSELYHLILDETGYVRELRQENTEESLARIENLEEFDNLLQEFEDDHFNRLPDTVTADEKAVIRAGLLERFIEQSSLVSDADGLDAYASSVKMMTLHSSKGLEFPVVFLVGMEEGLFPSIRSWEEVPEEDIEEERRLCYVGMTRAREVLFMMSVAVRRVWGNINYQEPSRFFDEIPAECIEFKDYTHTQATRSSYSSGSSGGASGYGGGKSFPSVNAGSRAYSGGSGTSSGSGGGYSSTSSSNSWNVKGPAAPKGKGDVVGERIMHPDYGPGTIIQSDGTGEDQKVTIEFKGRLQKKFLFRYVAGFIDDGSGY